MIKEDLVLRMAEASGLSESRCRETLEITMEVILRKMAAGTNVWIDGFGIFNAPKNGATHFRPAKQLLDAIENFDPMAPLPERFYHVDPSEPMPLATLDAAALPVHKIDPDDVEAIEGWLKWKQNQVSVAVPEVLYPEAGSRVPMLFSSAQTIAGARTTLRSFASRIPTTLATTGLVGDPGEYANYEHGLLRRDIMLYAKDYEQRMVRRLGEEGLRKLTERSRRRSKERTPIFFRTVGWRKFSTYAYELFDWMELQGLRPKGSNPMQGMRRFYEAQRGFGDIMINRLWYGTVLAYPRMLPRERCIIFLLQNGLRRQEAATAKIEHLNLRDRRMFVVGKGNKARHVYLYPWTVAAINEWLNERRDNLSPWLFPHKRRWDKHMRLETVASTVKDVTLRVYPRPDQKHIVEHIHPHGFRHYFATTATLRRVDPKTVMDAMGIESYRIFMQYIQVDDARRNREFAKVSNRRPF